MKTLLVIVGNCGSGKTHFIYNSDMCKSLIDEGAIVLDDLNSREELRKALMTGEHIIIADPWLCIESCFHTFLSFLEEHGAFDTHQITGSYFENNLEACLDNCKRRELLAPHKKVSPDFIRFLASRYAPKVMISKYHPTVELSLLPVFRLDNSVLAHYSK